MKTELSKEQRHKIYRLLLDDIKGDMYTGIGLGVRLSYISNFKINDLPELYKHKVPERAYWAPLTIDGLRTRIKWVEEAIEETKPYP